MSADRLESLVEEPDDLDPVDPDILLIGDYLGKALSAEQADAVERRLVDDEAFFEKVWPVVRIWRMPLRDRERRTRDIKRRPAPSTAPPLAIVPPSARPVSKETARHPTFERPPAAEPFEIELDTRRHFWPTLGMRTISVLKTAAMVAFAATSVATYYHWHNAPNIRSIASRLDRAPTVDIRQPVQVATGEGETKVITMTGGSRLILRPNSRMTYARIPGPMTRVGSAAFDGEIAIELKREDGYLTIETSSGRAMFTPGTYALRCEPGCAGMLVTVGVGMVNIRGDSGSVGAVTLHDGEKGRVPKHGSPEKVTPGTGWPALEPAQPGR